MTPRITIVTGFLGSGKTTLLRAMLERGAGRRIALVVNEIGQAGFDGPALGRAGGPPMVELTGGCICCAAGSDFLVAVEELIDMADPEQIVVETTGLAEPGGMIRQARAAGLPLDAAVAVAAADGLDAALAASPVAEWQLRAADILVLSKVDLASPAQIAGAEARLRELNPRAPIIRAAGGNIDPQLLFGPRLAGDDPPAAPGHLGLDGFGSFVWQGDTPLRRAALTEVMSSLPPQIYRAKGVVHCGDAPWPDELHYVGGRLELTPFRPREQTRPLNRLALIGAGAEGARAEIAALLDGCAEDAARAAAWEARHSAL
ncbi:GTP-binding protein [Oscillochloris sp. ZM17-4]|uniref:CobW family GTP-binding protein n=1 Tax=Oscillochloris sp. ZM17-4 TaxID=2866714 RepID=UPI001C72FD21|nr:GTP-binding protein [Oscillochloris sp. ZM17-4]MBX0326143.1 GTP-binding protein [Oscillochloris sp. ZM17-4]